MSLGSDVRFGARMLAKTPFLTAAAALSLALGIGANVVVLSWADAFVLRPLPGVAHQEGLLFLDVKNASGDDVKFSAPDFRDLERRAHTLSAPAAQNFQAFSLTSASQPERAWGQLVSGRFFETLEVKPFLGRLLAPADDAAAAAPAVVLGHGFWTRRFGADPNVVGRTLEINRHAFTIVGVASREFHSGVSGIEASIFLPLAKDGDVTIGGSRLEDRGKRVLSPLARLAPGATLAQARDELAQLSRALASEYPDTNRNLSMHAFRLPAAPYGMTELMRPVTTVLGGVSLLMLLIACANVANLLLARAVSRRREMAIRAALGAGRARLVRQLLVEALLLATLGGAGGVAAGLSAARVFPAFFPPTNLPVSAEMRADLPLLVSAALLTLFAGLALALGPALAATATRLVETLKEESGTALGGARAPRARRALVVAQVALSLVLLVAAALLLKGLQTARRIDPGFAPDGVLLATVDLAPLDADEAKGASLYGELLARAAAIPGVSSATLARYVPLTLGAFPQVKVELPGQAREKGEELSAGFNAVGPGYLTTMKTKLVAGRDIAATDRAGAPPVAVVNETFATRWLGGADALGRTFLANGREYTVVGIARDGKYDNLSEPRRPYVWLPFFQLYRPEAVLHVRGARDLGAVADALRREVRAVAPGLPLYDTTTLREHMAGPVFMYRVAATMLGVFGALALLLASVGLYGVIAHGVRERGREIAVRMALGAAPGAVSRLVVAQGAALAGTGLALGLAAALGATRLLRSFLFGVSPQDPVTLAAVAALLGLLALLASWLPAREASRVAPANALRS